MPEPKRNRVDKLRRSVRRHLIRPGTTGEDLTFTAPTVQNNVEHFQQITGAEVWEASLPVEPAVPRGAQTFQRSRSALLDTVFDRVPADVRPRGARIPGGSLVTSDGLVTSADGRFVREALLDDEHWRRVVNAQQPLVRRSRHLGGEWASLLSPWSGNYYHWIVDTLPRLAVLQAIGFDHVPVIVRGPVSPFQEQSLSIVGVPFTSILDDEQITVERLVWASAPSPVNFPTPFMVQWLRQRFTTGPKATETRRRLLISRTGSRRISNEQALTDALRPLGFERVEPDRLTIVEQAELFSKAGVIVGAHGAGLTNMLFSVRAKVLELFPPNRVAWHYYTLSQAAGHDYWYIVGRPRLDHRRPRNRNFHIDVPLVYRTVEAMIADDS